MLRFNPFTSPITKNNINVKDIINILQQYSYNNRIRRTPQIYLTEYNEMDNYYAIENEIPEQLVKNNKQLRYGEPESHYQTIDIKYYLRRYDPEFVLKGNRYESYGNPGFIYKNRLLTRLWYERKPNITEVNVLMEKGSFHYSYMMTINHQHTFEEAKNMDWAARLKCPC